MNKLEYIKDISTGIETISYENVNISYPEHTIHNYWTRKMNQNMQE